MLSLSVLLALSVAYWLLTSAVTWRAHRDMPRLPNLTPKDPASWPSLSLIIPACDEGDTLGPALQSRLAQDYPELQIIVIDDRSTDDTGAIADAAAALDARVRVIHVQSLPFCRMIGLGLRVTAIEDPNDRAAMGVGAFNLVRRSALQRSPGLAWLKLELIDDMALGQMLKRSGARSSVALGEHFVSLRHFYPDLRALMHGMEKNGFATLGRFSYVRLLASALGFFTLECVPFAALLASGAPLLQAAAALTLLIAFAQAVRANRLLGLPGHRALFFPLGTALLLGFGLRSGWLAARHGAIAWRGTRYPLRALREGSRLEFP